MLTHRFLQLEDLGHAVRHAVGAVGDHAAGGHVAETLFMHKQCLVGSSNSLEKQKSTGSCKIFIFYHLEKLI